MYPLFKAMALYCPAVFCRCGTSGKASATRISSIVLADSTHITHRFATSHIAVSHNWIVIIFWFAEQREIMLHVSPSLCTCTFFSCQCLGVGDVSRTTVV